MTPQFITLKSGCRLNVAHIVQYSTFLPNPEKLWIEVSSGVEGENEKLEDMTAAELDALLCPPSSPIVESIIDLDRLKPETGVQFTDDGVLRMGVIERVREDGVLVISSDGIKYTFYSPEKIGVIL